MPRPIVAALFLALSLAACGSPSSTNDEATAQAAQANGYAKALRTMPDGQRKATLYRAIADAKQQCQQVNAAQEIPPFNGMPAWSATCDTGQSWIVAIGADGTAKVTGPAAPPR